MISKINVKELSGSSIVTYPKLAQKRAPLFSFNTTINVDKAMIKILRETLKNFIECNKKGFIPNDIYNYKIPEAYYQIIPEHSGLLRYGCEEELYKIILKIKRLIIKTVWNIANSYETCGERPDDCYVDSNGVKYVYLNYLPTSGDGKFVYADPDSTGHGIYINILNNDYSGYIESNLSNYYPTSDNMIGSVIVVNAPIGYKTEGGIMKYDDPYKIMGVYLKKLFAQNGINLRYSDTLFKAYGRSDVDKDILLPGFRIEIYIPIN